VIRQVLAGAPGTARDIVVINAAAALWGAGRADTPQVAADSAAAAIDSGAAKHLLEELVALSNR
jgi:anthranilate phosphoribosyltransferase